MGSTWVLVDGPASWPRVLKLNNTIATDSISYNIFLEITESCPQASMPESFLKFQDALECTH
jgi:hypothetical protein